MNAITFPDFNERIGSVTEVWFAPVEDITVFPPAVEGQTEEVTFANGKDWIPIYGSAGSMSLDVDTVKSEAGISHSVKVTGVYPTDLAATLEQFRQMAAMRFVVLCITAIGETFICGTLVNPLRFIYKKSTGPDAASRSGYTWEFGGITEYPPWFTTYNTGGGS